MKRPTFQYRVVIHDAREDGSLEDTINAFIRDCFMDERAALTYVSQVIVTDSEGWWTRTTLYFLVVHV